MTPRAALVTAILVAPGCRISTAPGDNVLTSQPQWEWQSACCGFAGNELTAATEGFTYILQFGTDGTVRAIRAVNNDSILAQTRYRLVTSGGGAAGDPSTTVEYDEPLPLGPGVEPAPKHLLVLLENGVILLRNLSPCADCFGDWTFFPRLVQ